MELPLLKRAPISQNPHTMLIYSPPKVGKTTIVAQLENSLLVEHEPHGGDFVEANIIEINKPSELLELFKTIESSNKPYKYIIIDTITKWDEWSEIIGTYEYMDKPQGKKFNKTSDGKSLHHMSKKFETVHEIPNGFGYRYSRQVMIDWFDRITLLADHIIFLAHIKDKLIESKKSGDTVESIDINLTGKVKSIYTSRVDAVGHLYRKGNKAIINFNNENSFTCGGRCKHLNEEVVISEKLEDGTIKTFWEKIYIPNK